ncbi:MAG: methyl-accepting chemotaxis protein, partial [Planctomycetota bacterium]|nr:methyl-accepting chemotaxis protein [Planctomycetota bacterium]
MNPFFSSTVKIFLAEVAVYLAVTFGLHFSLFSSTLRGFFSLPAEVDSFLLVPALYSGLVAMLVAVLVSLYMRSRIRQQNAAMEQDTLDNVLNPVIILDDMNRYVILNRAAELTLSLNRNQSIGTSASQEISSLANGSTAKFGKDLFKVMRCQASFGGLDQSSVMITLTDISRDVMLKETMASITRAMGDLESNSIKITDSSTMLSQGATEQASSLASITTFLGEINKKGQGSSTAATKGTQLAIQAREAAEHSSAEIVNTLKAMADVQEAGVRIARIVKIIDDVAFQTNLLALNAAVEAARAGRHGKGFAVVADEVRNLAGRSAKAAKDTASMVEDITTRLGNAGSYIHKLEEMVRNIVQDAIRMSDATASASSASAEQASGIQQVNRELIQMDTVTHSTMLAAEQTAAAVGVFSRQTTDVKKMLEEITAAFHIASENQSGAPSSQRSRRPEY